MHGVQDLVCQKSGTFMLYLHDELKLETGIVLVTRIRLGIVEQINWNFPDKVNARTKSEDQQLNFENESSTRTTSCTLQKTKIIAAQVKL